MEEALVGKKRGQNKMSRNPSPPKDGRAKKSKATASEPKNYGFQPKQEQTKKGGKKRNKRRKKRRQDRRRPDDAPQEPDPEDCNELREGKAVVDGTAMAPQAASTLLCWRGSADPVPVSVEEAMLPLLLQWGDRERGMMKIQPFHRVKKIEKEVRKHDGKITLLQVLSLRRHHMKLLNPKKSMPVLQLGCVRDIQESARLFEVAVENFLRKSRIEFWDEREQAQNWEKIPTNERPGTLLTPDFLLRQPVLLQKMKVRGTQKRIRVSWGGKKNCVNELLEERTIHWIEAKMFFGASTIPHNTNNAVGTILPKAKRYVERFGEGAILFMNGAGEKLVSDLAAIGVSVLDCSMCVDLRHVKAHQRTWCAHDNGKILP